MFVAQLCPSLCDSMDYSPSVSSVHGILQAATAIYLIKYIKYVFNIFLSFPMCFVLCI